MGSESKNGVGLSSPASEWSPETRKMVQSLKEIVYCPESEIYAILRDCNMDPNDTVQRLLSQDTFHEVKSKRERRKEMKETQESRPRVNYSSSSTRGIRILSERGTGWNGSSQAGYEEIGNVAHKGENVSLAPSPPLSHLTSHIKGETVNQHPLSFNSDSLSTDSRGQSIGTGDVIASTVQHSTTCQPSWLGTSSGHLSMADIVRIGRPASKSSQVSSEAASYLHSDAVVTNSFHHYEKPYQVSAHVQAESHDDLHSQNVSNKSESSVGQNSILDDRSVVEQPTVASESSTLEASFVTEADTYPKHSNYDESKLSKNSHSHSVEAPEGDFSNGNISSDSIVTASISSGLESITNAVGASHCDDSEPGRASNLSDPNFSTTRSDDVVDVPSASTKLEHLNLGEEPENNCAVVLPSHLQVLAADCSHLSFGTYKSGNNSVSTVPSPSNQSKDDRQEATTIPESVSTEPLETRNMGYAENESLGSLYNSHKTTTEVNSHTTKYDLTAAFTSELMKEDGSEASLGSEYIKPSLHDPNVENIGHTTHELSFARTDQNIGNLSIQTQPASIESTPRDIFVSKFLSLSESDNLQAQYLAKQLIPSRHGNTSMSFSEDRKPPGAFSLSSPSLAASNQHRRAPSYSQPNLPPEQQTNNMISYSSLHQNYSQLPSTLQQQAFSSRDDFNHSLADLNYSLPQHGASMSRFPGTSATAGYGSYGTSSNVLVNYLQSTQSPMVANSGYNGAFRPQYSDGDNFTSVQQNGSSSSWNMPGSRMMPSAQELAYYNLLGQNQQYAGFRQGQQRPSQYDGTFGYSNLYRPQPGVARDHQHQQQQQNFDHQHQQQNFGGSTAGDSPDLLSQQLHQLWRQH